MILGFCVSGITVAAAHWRCELKCTGSSQVANFFVQLFFNAHCIVRVTNIELQDINRLMGYRDAQ